jgi:hypothetical protein
MTSEKPFWQTKQLHEMTTEEWESLCDGCGRCCLVKLEDEDTGEIHDTDVSCQLLDCSTCCCTDYTNRHEIVDDCIKLDVDKLEELRWLPRTCAYRLLWEGKPLFDWHPLVSSDPQSVHEAGVSVKDKVTNEREVALEDLVNRIREW